MIIYLINITMVPAVSLSFPFTQRRCKEIKNSLSIEMHFRKERWRKLKRGRKGSRWAKDLNVSCLTETVLKETVGSKMSDISRNKIFTHTAPRAGESKEKINKWV